MGRHKQIRPWLDRSKHQLILQAALRQRYHDGSIPSVYAVGRLLNGRRRLSGPRIREVQRALLKIEAFVRLCQGRCGPPDANGCRAWVGPLRPDQNHPPLVTFARTRLNPARIFLQLSGWLPKKQARIYSHCSTPHCMAHLRFK
jgi:hypothetical protein